MSETTIWLVRHGESTWNEARLVQGQSPHAGPLTERGQRQVTTLAEELAQRAPKAKVIISSDLLRARQSADILANRLNVPVRLERRLREQSLGVLEGTRLDENFDGHTVREALNNLWHDEDRRHLGPSEGESVTALYERVSTLLADIAAEFHGADVILVTHGGPMRAALAACAGGIAHCRRYEIANASILAMQLHSNRDASRRGVAWEAVVGSLLTGPEADEAFAEDMETVRESIGPMPPDPWQRS